MKLLITGATGLTGSLLLSRLAQQNSVTEVDCLIRPESDRSIFNNFNLTFNYHLGDSSSPQTWDQILSRHQPETIIHIASIRHIGVMVDSLRQARQTPRLIVIGTTGVYSKYNEYAYEYKEMERRLREYSGSYCLLKPTMIYGSERDKNLHKLIKFCDRYGFFYVFGSGNCLLQPIHADDLAQALLSVYQNAQIEGEYDLSGGSVVSFRELLKLVGEKLGKKVRSISFPLNLGVAMASFLETLLKKNLQSKRNKFCGYKKIKLILTMLLLETLISILVRSKSVFNKRLN